MKLIYSKEVENRVQRSSQVYIYKHGKVEQCVLLGSWKKDNHYWFEVADSSVGIYPVKVIYLDEKSAEQDLDNVHSERIKALAAEQSRLFAEKREIVEEIVYIDDELRKLSLFEKRMDYMNRMADIDRRIEKINRKMKRLERSKHEEKS
ncbi:MAG: hypothetical protein WC471_03030 [Candidatus Woesearchaeota archaeon]